METFTDNWTNHFNNTVLKYPAETLVRILKGNFPKLNFDKNYCEKTVLEMGCGSGNNLIALHDVGFKKIIGIDLTQGIIDKARKNLEKQNISNVIFKTGANTHNPQEDESVDFYISWGNLYYMDSKNKTIEDNLKEVHRVLAKQGVFIASIEKYDAEVYRSTEQFTDDGKYVYDKNFNAIMRRFKNKSEIISVFGQYFSNIVVGDLNFDCFGKNYSHYIIVCSKSI